MKYRTLGKTGLEVSILSFGMYIILIQITLRSFMQECIARTQHSDIAHYCSVCSRLQVDIDAVNKLIQLVLYIN